jgi:hypothetical protein
VRRSVLFSHETTKQRMMANLSDTHISLANIQNLASPTLESIVEVAPYLNELFRYGDHIVEQVQPRTSSGWDYTRNVVEFRVKRAGGDIDGATPVATFMVGQVQRAIKHGDQLVVFRYVPPGGGASNKLPGGGVASPTAAISEAVVFDLSDPTKPRLAGRTPIPVEAFPYYRFYCGSYWDGYWWGGYYGNGTSWADTAAGLVVTRQTWDQTAQTSRWKLLFLDLRNPNQPQVTDRELALGKDTYVNGLTVDTIDGRGFYLGYRTLIGQTKGQNNATFFQWKDYAARWELDGSTWVQRSRLNVPGSLIRTFRSADGERLLLTSDYVSRWVTTSDPAGKPQSYYVSWTRTSLLREIDLGGRAAAELLDTHTFDNLYLASLVSDGDKLFINGRKQYYYAYAVPGAVATGGGGAAPATTPVMQDLSDRLMAFDLGGKKLQQVYDASTGMYNVELMGINKGRLFANLAGDGILITDVSDPAAPKGLHFERTLGYATHIEFVGSDVYVGSGFFGTRQIDLTNLRALGGP